MKRRRTSLTASQEQPVGFSTLPRSDHSPTRVVVASHLQEDTRQAGGEGGGGGGGLGEGEVREAGAARIRAAREEGARGAGGGGAVDAGAGGGVAGGGEWEPDGTADCYSLELDSTWEVVEQAEELLIDSCKISGSTLPTANRDVSEHLTSSGENLAQEARLMARSSQAAVGPTTTKVIKIPIIIEAATHNNSSSSSSSCGIKPAGGHQEAGSQAGLTSRRTASEAGGCRTEAVAAVTPTRIIPILLADGRQAGRAGGQGAAEVLEAGGQNLDGRTGQAVGSEGPGPAGGLRARLASGGGGRGRTNSVEEEQQQQRRSTTAAEASANAQRSMAAETLVKATSSSASDIWIETRRHLSGEEGVPPAPSTPGVGEPDTCRTIPIQLATGQVIRPRFTDLKDPAPPTWSVFHQKGGEQERVVPIRVEGQPGTTGAGAARGAAVGGVVVGPDRPPPGGPGQYNATPGIEAAVASKRRAGPPDFPGGAAAASSVEPSDVRSGSLSSAVAGLATTPALPGAGKSAAKRGAAAAMGHAGEATVPIVPVSLQGSDIGARGASDTAALLRGARAQTPGPRATEQNAEVTAAPPPVGPAGATGGMTGGGRQKANSSDAGRPAGSGDGKQPDGFARLRESLPTASEFRSSVEREIRSTASNFKESKSEFSELRSEFSSSRSEMLSSTTSHSTGVHKPPAGTKAVPITSRRVPPAGGGRDEPLASSSGEETLPSGWTPHHRRPAETGGRGRRDRPAGGGTGGGGDGTEETPQDCLSRVHAELEAARKQLSEQMEQMKGSLPNNNVPYVGRPAGHTEHRSRSVEADRQVPREQRQVQDEERRRPSFRRDRSLQDIDKDIETIWKELQELDRLPVDSSIKKNPASQSSGGERPPSAPPSLAQQTLVTPSWRSVRTRTQSEHQAGPPLVTRTRAALRDLPPATATTSQRRTIWDSPGQQQPTIWDGPEPGPQSASQPAKYPPSGSQQQLSSSWDSKPNYFPTSSGPTHFSFLPKAETKPGAITPTYVSASTARSGSRTVPIVKEGADPYRKLDFPSYSSRDSRGTTNSGRPANDLTNSSRPANDSINSSRPASDFQRPLDTRRPWTYRPGEWRGVASMSNPNLGGGGGLGGGSGGDERRREVPITRSESPSGGQTPANLKSCLKDSKAKPSLRTRSVSPLGRISPTKQSVNFTPDIATVRDMGSGPGESAYDWVDIAGERKLQPNGRERTRVVPITSLPALGSREPSTRVSDGRAADGHVENGGKSADGRHVVGQGGNPFGPEDGVDKGKGTGNTVIATEEACFACDACTQTETKEKKNGCHMM